MKSFLEQAQLDEGRGDEKGPSPWAYRAQPVSYARAEELIDYDTERLIQQRKESTKEKQP